MYCDSTGCSYDAKKNPRVAKYAVTVAEFDDCSYEEYEDTVFLCGQCNMKCLRKVNGSKIKFKMPIEKFLAQRDSEEDSFSVAALDLPPPPPVASDFPALPRAAPAPKMTKAEKAVANKINSLLLSSGRADIKPGSPPTAVKPTPNKPSYAPAPTAVKSLSSPEAKSASMPEITEAPVTPVKTLPIRVSPAPSPMALPGIIPIPISVQADMLASSPQPSGACTPIMAMAALHAEHVVSCSHDTSTCGVCRVGITCCKCHLMYTAPAAKRMRCTSCLHWACDLDQSTGCCECNTPWVPLNVISLPAPGSGKTRAARFRGGAGSDSASQSSSKNSTQDDSTVKIKIAAPTQESVDEIDAFSRPSSAGTGKGKSKDKKRRHPKSGQSSREPSRPSSVASDRLSTTETVLPKPDYEVPLLAHEYGWAPPPADVTTLPGYVYEAHQEKTLHVDDDDVTHFIKRGSVDINDISNLLRSTLILSSMPCARLNSGKVD